VFLTNQPTGGENRKFNVSYKAWIETKRSKKQQHAAQRREAEKEKAAR
jgi:hypothetical protein